MLLAGKLVGLLALLDQLIGILCTIVYFFNVLSWRDVAAETPFFKENSGFMLFLGVTSVSFLGTGLLQLVAIASNNRLLWWLSLFGKAGLLGCSVILGIHVWLNRMRTEDFLREQIVPLFEAYNQSKPVSDFLDWIHRSYQCCGYRSDHSEWLGIIGPRRVPESCCVAPNPGCGVNNQTAWLTRINNAVCHSVMWTRYEDWDPQALLLYLMLVYLMWVGVLLNFYKVFLALYLACEVAKYLRSMDALQT